MSVKDEIKEIFGWLQERRFSVEQDKASILESIVP